MAPFGYYPSIWILSQDSTQHEQISSWMISQDNHVDKEMLSRYTQSTFRIKSKGTCESSWLPGFLEKAQFIPWINLALRL